MTLPMDQRGTPLSSAAGRRTDFFRSQFGNYIHLPFWRRRRLSRLVDLLFDLRLKLNRSFRVLSNKASAQRRLNVLVLGVDVPARSADLTRVLKSLNSTLHNVTCARAPLREGRGKFQNINEALKDYRIQEFDWIIVTDDDIEVSPQFLDIFLYLAEQQELKICMPAHRFNSYMGYAITQRYWNSLVRVTHFVECGPLTAFHRDAFSFCLPFSETRWAWGVDVLWSEEARARGLRIGVVDATAMKHLRPVAESYDNKAAREEAEQLLESRSVQSQRSEILRNVTIVRSLP